MTSKCPKDFEIEKVISPNGKKLIYYRCIKKKYCSFLKKYLQCLYKIRSDNYNYKNHKCNFLILNSFFTNIEKKNENSFEEQMFIYLGSSEISINSFLTNETYSFLKFIYNFGQNNPSKSFEEICPILSRKTLTKKLINYSNLLKNDIISKFSGYSSLCIDAGKVGHENVLNIVLVKANVPELKPFLFETIYGFRGDYESYKSQIVKTIKTLEQNKIFISSIVSDNLPVQIKAVDDEHFWSFQNQTEDYSLKKNFRVSCLCHTLNLALKDVFLKEPFCHHINLLDNIIPFFRSKLIKRVIGSICPNRCLSRWLNLFEIFNWGFIHRGRIISIIKTSNPIIREKTKEYKKTLKKFIFDSIPLFYIPLFLYNKLILIFEQDHFLITNVIVTVMEFIDYSKIKVAPILSKESKIFLENLISYILERLKKMENSINYCFFHPLI